jgi:hypothetical protein
VGGWSRDCSIGLPFVPSQKRRPSREDRRGKEKLHWKKWQAKKGNELEPAPLGLRPSQMIIRLLIIISNNNWQNAVMEKWPGRIVIISPPKKVM